MLGFTDDELPRTLLNTSLPVLKVRNPAQQAFYTAN